EQHQAAWFVGEGIDDGRQTELVDAEDFKRNDAKNSRNGAALHENIAAKPAQTFDAKREIELVVGFKNLFLAVRQHAVAEHACVLRREFIGFERDQRSVDAKLRGCTDGDVQIACALVNHDL